MNDAITSWSRDFWLLACALVLIGTIRQFGFCTTHQLDLVMIVVVCTFNTRSSLRMAKKQPGMLNVYLAIDTSVTLVAALLFGWAS